MPEVAQQEVRAALDDVLAARDELVQILKLCKPGEPGVLVGSGPRPPPATAEHLARLEDHFALRFPPSYKHLLALHDGIPDIDLGSDLFGVDRVLHVAKRNATKTLERILPQIKRTDASSLVIFSGSAKLGMLAILDLGAHDERGECKVLYLNKREKIFVENDDLLGHFAHTAGILRYGASLYRR